MSATRLAVLETLGTLLGLATALFLPAGRLDWPMGWALVAFYTAFAVAGFVLLPPDLIAERSRIPRDASPLDLALGGLAAAFLLPGTLVVCGLDARAGGSPAFPAAMRVGAFALFCLGYAFSLWAARSNPFFSAAVRIQKDRGHRVVRTGPYAFVRHPGYAGAMLGHLALPIALGSARGLLPAVAGCLFLALRAVNEERTLEQGLPGYREYRLRVPWRLVPHVW